jgi:hypothetical protein
MFLFYSEDESVQTKVIRFGCPGFSNGQVSMHASTLSHTVRMSEETRRHFVNEDVVALSRLHRACNECENGKLIPELSCRSSIHPGDRSALSTTASAGIPSRLDARISTSDLNTISEVR